MFFEPDAYSNNNIKGPKRIAPEDQKNCKRGPKYGQIKNKKVGLYFQKQS